MNLNKIFIYTFLVGVDLFLWKYALAGLLGKKMVFKRGKEKYEIKGGKSKIYGALFLLAAIGVGWTILEYFKMEN